MNHSLSCTVFSRGSPISKSSWNLGETELDRQSFLGDLESGDEYYIITDPQFVWLNSDVPVTIETRFKRDDQEEDEVITTESVMTYVNSFDPSQYDECTVLIITDGSADVGAVANIHCISIADNARKILSREFK